MDNKQCLIGAVVIVRISVPRYYLEDSFFCVFFFFVGSQVRMVRGLKHDDYVDLRAKYQTQFCYFICNFWCFEVLQLLSLFFCTPKSAFHHYLKIHLERAGPMFRFSQARIGSLGDNEIWVVRGRKSPKGSVQNFGESLNICIPVRISLPHTRWLSGVRVDRTRKGQRFKSCHGHGYECLRHV